MVSLLAKQEFAVPRVIARVNHPKNEWLFNENWGVDLSVSTPHLITALVEEAVTVGRLVRILQFEGGQARLVEVTLAEDSPVIDRALKDIDVPRNATIVAIVRDEHVVMPRGDSVFEAGDEVLAMVTPESEDEVRRILTGAAAGLEVEPRVRLEQLVDGVEHQVALAVAGGDALERRPGAPATAPRSCAGPGTRRRPRRGRRSP